jgi:hypothetical protein
MDVAHHGGLVDGSICVAPFFELKPAAIQVNIMHTANEGQS